MADLRSVLEAQSATEAPPAAPQQTPVRAAIGVIMTRFPKIDETFILREINELERHGQPVVVVPLLQDNGKVLHEEAKPWVQRALYTPIVSLAILRSNLKALFARPRKYLGLLFTLIAGTILRPSTCLRTLALFPKSVHLAEVLPAQGIRHVHSHFATHATTMAYIIASMSDITYSFTVHGPDVFVHRMLLREKIEKAQFIRAVSSFNKAFLCGLYPVLSDGKIEVVHSGVNPDVYEEAASRARRRKGEKLQLLSVAALSSSRGFPFLVDACAKLVKSGLDIECRIVGAGPLRRVTEQWIAEHGLADSVKLVGALPQHEVARLMGEADIYVLPSIIAVDGQMDGIPISLMEAMAAGKPVVASSISGIPELVRHDESGVLVDAAYAERLAEAVRQLVDQPELREAMGRAGRAKVRREFDVRKNAQKLVALFDRFHEANAAEKSKADWVASLNWSRLGATALGVRRVHERADSFVAEVTISDGVSRREVIVRQPREVEGEHSPVSRARAEFETVSTLRQSMNDETTAGIAYTLPRLLMFDEPNAALVLERANGTSLAGIMRGRGGARLAIAVRRAGTWLRTMQRSTEGSEDGRHVLTAVLVLAQRDLGLAAAGDRLLRREREAILERLRLLEAKVAGERLPVVGHHGDFAPDNIFIGDRRVDVLDFASYREGLPFEDVAQFLIHLRMNFSGRNLEKLTGAFLEGYGTSASDDTMQLFTLTKALQMLAHGGHGEQARRALREIVARSIE